jgi:hypothetical protein
MTSFEGAGEGSDPASERKLEKRKNISTNV